MADAEQTLYTTDDSVESENSSEEAKLELVCEQYIYMQQLLPSGIMVVSEKSDKLNDVAPVLPYATLRTRQTSCLPTEDHASAITSRLRLNSKLVQNDRKSEKLRIETLKAMPQCLTVKRSVKSKLEATVAQKPKVKTLSYWKWFKYRSSYTFSRIHIMIRDTLPSLELWYNTIKSVEGQCGSGIAAYFKFLRWLVGLNIISCILSVSFIILPQSLKQTHAITNITASDFLTGSGFFTNTIMYYGFYMNDTIEQAGEHQYHIPSAYFITFLCCYVLILTILSVKVAQSYRKCYVEISGKVQNMYSNKIFCGWDFSISSSRAASLHSGSIYRDLKELLAEAVQYSPPECIEQFLTIIIRIIITLITLVMISGTGVLLWILLDKLELDRTNTLSLMVVPTVVTIIMQFFPAIISYLARFEKYSSKRVELYVTVIRIHGMAATVVGMHLAFWIMNSTSDCWQTRLGEEIYRLILLDFIVVTLGTLAFEVARGALSNRDFKWIGKPEFDIARSTLNLIYNQSLFWLGFYFSPCLSIIILVKMIFIFYVKKYGLFKCYKSPLKPWRAAQTETLFLALAFIGMVAVITSLGYIITRVETNDCGPFRGYENTWEFVVNVVLSLDKDSETWKIISQLGSPAAVAVILVSMCIAVYWLRARVEASKEMLSILREMLLLQARDKEFLMRSIAKISKERHIFDPSSSPSPSRASSSKYTKSSAQGSGDCSQDSRRRTIPSASHHQDDYV